VGMGKIVLRFISWFNDLNDLYWFAKFVWGLVMGSGAFWLANINTLPLATKFVLALIAFAAALVIWVALDWAGTKTSWGKKAKRRARLNAFLNRQSDTFVLARHSSTSEEFWHITNGEYQPWAEEVREYLRGEYAQEAGDSWYRIGRSFNAIPFGRQGEKEDEKLTEMSILYKRLENILAKENGESPTPIPELEVYPQLGTTLSANAGLPRHAGSTGPTRRDPGDTSD